MNIIMIIIVVILIVVATVIIVLRNTGISSDDVYIDQYEYNIQLNSNSTQCLSYSTPGPRSGTEVGDPLILSECRTALGDEKPVDNLGSIFHSNVEPMLTIDEPHIRQFKYGTNPASLSNVKYLCLQTKGGTLDSGEIIEAGTCGSNSLKILANTQTHQLQVASKPGMCLNASGGDSLWGNEIKLHACGDESTSSDKFNITKRNSGNKKRTLFQQS